MKTEAVILMPACHTHDVASFFGRRTNTFSSGWHMPLDAHYFVLNSWVSSSILLYNLISWCYMDGFLFFFCFLKGVLYGWLHHYAQHKHYCMRGCCLILFNVAMFPRATILEFFLFSTWKFSFELHFPGQYFEQMIRPHHINNCIVTLPTIFPVCHWPFCFVSYKCNLYISLWWTF
jgi:hypothetical protein